MYARFRPILITALAGIVTPAVAMLFYLIADALYEGNFPELASFAFMLPAAAIFGAPFAISVAFVLRLRHLWAAVPVVAVAAAFGIEIQIQTNRFSNGTNFVYPAVANDVSGGLMLIWIFPTILGTIAAMLFKMHARLTTVAICAIAGIVLIFSGVEGASDRNAVAPAHAAALQWSKLRVGMHVFTGNQGSGRGQIVCSSMAEMLANSPKGCRRIALGTAATVTAIVPCKVRDAIQNYAYPIVRLRAANRVWDGFASAAVLQPDIPVGTLIDMESDGGGPLLISDSRNVRTSLGHTALVRLLRYDPKSSLSLYVSIVAGAMRGRTGWMAIQNAATGQVALGLYSLQYDYQSCMSD